MNKSSLAILVLFAGLLAFGGPDVRAGAAAGKDGLDAVLHGGRQPRPWLCGENAQRLPCSRPPVERRAMAHGARALQFGTATNYATEIDWKK